METMSLTLTTTLGVLTILLLASGAYFLARRIRVPYTALLAFVGILLAPLSALVPGLAFVHDLTLTPDLLFFVFLPTLIFESAYNMRIRQLTVDALPITMLSIVSLMASACFIAGGMYLLLSLIGFPIPFTLALLFGALISATDPVAVLALFKEYGAPRRLALIFEGESLFNDGTSYALFLIVLAVALEGYHGVGTVIEGIGMFTEMVLGGIVFGLIMGGLFSKLVERVRSNEFISITLMLILAHLTFILTELSAHLLQAVGITLHLSAIIATTVAAIVLGNYGRYKVSLRAEAFVEKFWGMLAFLANSLIFVLIGFLFSELPTTTHLFLAPILLSIVIVAVGRAFSIYPIVALSNLLVPLNRRVSRAWQHVLAWGSLRGALAVTMVLLVPDTLSFPGWKYTFSPKEFLLAVTVGCIFTTLFIKATTIGPLMRRLGVNKLTELEVLEYEEVRALIHSRVLLKLEQLRDRGYIDEATYTTVHASHEAAFTEACTLCSRLVAGDSATLAERVVRLYAIGIEKQYSRDLFTHGEITEPVMKRMASKQELQAERAERGVLDSEAEHWRVRRDVLEFLADNVRRLLHPSRTGISAAERYLYYRAQSIVAQRVVRALDELMADSSKSAIFTEQALTHTRERYLRYVSQAREKMHQVAEGQDREQIERLRVALTRRGLFKTEEILLADLYHKDMVTPKVYLTLREEFERLSAHEHERV